MMLFPLQTGVYGCVAVPTAVPGIYTDSWQYPLEPLQMAANLAGAARVGETVMLQETFDVVKGHLGLLRNPAADAVQRDLHVADADGNLQNTLVCHTTVGGARGKGEGEGEGRSAPPPPSPAPLLPGPCPCLCCAPCPRWPAMSAVRSLGAPCGACPVMTPCRRVFGPPARTRPMLLGSAPDLRVESCWKRAWGR